MRADGVELGNAMILSGLRGGAKVTLPMDSSEFTQELTKLVAASPHSAAQAESFAQSASPVAQMVDALVSSATDQ